MGEILNSICKNCNFKTDSLMHGGGKDAKGPFHCIVLNKIEKKIESFQIDLPKLDPEKLIRSQFHKMSEKESKAYLYSRLPIDEGRYFIYFFDTEVSKRKNLLERMRINRRMFEPEYKHKCPECNSFTLQFENTGLWD